MPLDRTWYNTLVDDDGSNTVGTPWTKAAVDSLLDAVDALPAAGSTFTAHGVLVGNGTSAVAVTGAGTAGQVLTSNGASADPTFQAAAAGSTVVPSVCEGRLTLESGVAVSTTDQTAKTNVYFTPYKGNRISLYSGSAWVAFTFTEKTLALGTLTNDLPYDVFLYDNAGTLTLEALAWTSKTARATALVLQDGVYCKTGALTRRYLGTFHTTATTTTEDSEAKRLLWNYYNQRPRSLRRVETTANWTYTTKTWRQANASAANQVAFVIGVNEQTLTASLTVEASQANSGVAYGVGFALDQTTGPTTGAIQSAQNSAGVGFLTPVGAYYSSMVAAGYHYLAWLEISAATGTTTWRSANDQAFGEQSGIVGTIQG